MAYSEFLAQRVRRTLRSLAAAEEMKMFGGIAFMVDGNMAVGVTEENLIVRVGLRNYETCLRKPGADLFKPTGKPMAGWITVNSAGLQNEEAVRSWIELSLDFVRTLPGK